MGLGFRVDPKPYTWTCRATSQVGESGYQAYATGLGCFQTDSSIQRYPCINHANSEGGLHMDLLRMFAEP